MSKAPEYYYNMLNKEQKKAYFMIKEGLLEMRNSFPVPRLSQKELSDIYFMIRMDHPEIFWSVTFSYSYYDDSSMVKFSPKYFFFDKEKRIEQKKALDSRIKKLCGQMQKMNEKEKELFIHDFICNNVKYDKLKKEYSHEIIGALGNGTAVCEGIAKAVKILCDNVGIWCIIALSDSNPEKGIKYRHAWNIVKINGQYYHLDATFDNTLSKDDIIRHDYFNLSDKKIFRDHEPVIWKIPECTDNDSFYYRENKISWTTFEEVEKHTKQAVKKGKTLLFHWRGGYFTKEVVKQIFDIFSKEAKEKNKTFLCSVNYAQAVLCVRFKDGVGESSVEIEEANEGEALE